MPQYESHHPVQSHGIMLPLSHITVAATKAKSRDKVPLPSALQSVIRNQKAGNIEMAQHMHTFSQRGQELAQSTQCTAKNKASISTPHRIRPRKTPTLQEMYNTWRSLEEQMGRITRLPMFIKAERKACHSCRIMKQKCACFDYSDLEKGFQETDTALKQAMIRESSFAEDPDAFSVAAGASNLEGTVDTDPAALSSPVINNPSEEFKADTSPAPLQWLPLESAHHASRNREIDEIGRPINDMLGSPSKPADSDFDFNEPLTATGHVENGEDVATTIIPRSVPKLVKCEIRTVIIAREKVVAHSLRWRCQFGSSKPGHPICAREDDNLETIRRHYGREHGKHRYYQKPKTRSRCKRCSFVVEKSIPSQCPGCQTVRGGWVREVYALIEVPVPPSTCNLGEMSRNSDHQNNCEGWQKMAPVSTMPDAAATLQHSSGLVPAPWTGYSTSLPCLQSYAPLDMATTVSGIANPVLTPATPKTPLSPTTPLSPAPAVGDTFFSDPMSLFPYDSGGMTETQQRPLFSDNLVGILPLCNSQGHAGLPSFMFNDHSMAFDFSQAGSSMTPPVLSWNNTETVLPSDIELHHNLAGTLGLEILDMETDALAKAEWMTGCKDAFGGSCDKVGN